MRDATCSGGPADGPLREVVDVAVGAHVARLTAVGAAFPFVLPERVGGLAGVVIERRLALGGAGQVAVSVEVPLDRWRSEERGQRDAVRLG